MKLMFLVSHRRKNSVRDKVIGKKWIYSDTGRSTLRVWAIAEGECGGSKMWHSFYRLGNFICSRVGELFQLLWGRGRNFLDLGHRPLLGLLTGLIHGVTKSRTPLSD